VNVEPSLIANDQSAVVIEPSQSALDYPPMSAQPLTALYSTSGYMRNDASLTQSTPASLVVVPFICVQLARSLTSASAQLGRFPIGLIASTTSVRALESCTLAAVQIMARETPCLSTTTWRFVLFSFIRRIRAGSFAPF
jgi:hypothetical protein